MSNIKLISTSALSKKLSIPKNSLDEILIEVGFIEKSEEVSNLDNVLLKMLLKFGVQTY